MKDMNKARELFAKVDECAERVEKVRIEFQDALDLFIEEAESVANSLDAADPACNEMCKEVIQAKRWRLREFHR